MKSATSRGFLSPQKDKAHAGVFAVASSPADKNLAADPPTSRLVMRDSTGEIINSWPLSQSKITLGSSDECSIQFSHPGVQPVHCLIIPGARQIFIRALAPNVTQGGVPANEILLSNRRNYFEIAGHRFEFLPGIRQENSNGSGKSAERLRFATVRPVDSTDRRAMRLEGKNKTSQEIQVADTPWLNRLIQKTIEPLEAQIESLLLPVAEFQARVVESEQSRKTEAEQSQQQREAMASEFSEIVSRQSDTMENLSRRLSEVNEQLSTIERIIAEENSAVTSATVTLTQEVQSVGQEVEVHRTAVEQLQAGMVAVTDSLKELRQRQDSIQSEEQQWKSEVQEQLEELSGIVAEIKDKASQNNSAEILEAVLSLQQHQDNAQEEVRNWQYRLQEQLESLESRLHEVRHWTTSAAPTPDDAAETGRPAAVEPFELATESEIVPSRDCDETIHENPAEQSNQPIDGDFIELPIEPIGEQDLEFPTNLHSAGQAEELGLDFSCDPANHSLSSVSGHDWLEQWAAPNASASDPNSAAVESIPLASTPMSLDWHEDSLDSELDKSSELDEDEAARIEQAAAEPLESSSKQNRSEEPEEFFFGLSPLNPTDQSIADSQTYDKTELVGQLHDDNTSDQRIQPFQSGVSSGALPSENLPPENLPFGDLPSWWTDDGQSSGNQDVHEATEILSAESFNVNAELPEDALPDRASDEFQQAQSQETTGGEERSVESYMQELLARMRGDSTLVADSSDPETPAEARTLQEGQTPSSVTVDPTSLISGVPAEPMDWDSYISLTKAPEKNQNIDLLRDLANSSARTAIQHSARRRHLSGGLLKLTVCLVALTVAGVLFTINGLEVNIGLVATFASLLVAIIWGYDGLVSLKPLFRNSLILDPPASEQELGPESGVPKSPELTTAPQSPAPESSTNKSQPDVKTTT